MKQTAPIMKKSTTILSDTADEIAAGKYKTLDEAKQAVSSKMMLVMMQAQKLAQPAATEPAPPQPTGTKPDGMKDDVQKN